MFSSVSQLPLPSVTNLQVDSVNFPPSVISPASSNPLFLGGAGVRGIDVLGDKFVIITFFGVYLGPVAVPLLSVKWKGKTTVELMESVPFFREVVTGDYTSIKAASRTTRIHRSIEGATAASILQQFSAAIVYSHRFQKDRRRLPNRKDSRL
ncbi:hypothetical protein F2Q70_00033527 [Brassica cretica]|uniref:Chalcone-flavonone isomerase family protein n=1 Tax=Brassica cretica TaxID=69181 RepID=A0A8S9FJ44_BRACR|nr:hypothetical protein F2Q70_00033527 [Brassica cretica]